jgi:DNA-binding response OmpR family regulator
VPQVLRILVGEADSQARQSLMEALSLLGHRVTIATSGRCLAELAHIVKPDLALIDTALPDMDGFRAAEAVNREWETPVILVARRPEPEDMKRLVGDHLMAYLVMPVGRSALEAAIPFALVGFQRYLLGRKKAGDLRRALEGHNPPGPALPASV